MTSPLLVERADTRPIHLPPLRRARLFSPHVAVWTLLALNVTMLILWGGR